ncbi:hypothetical protein B7453_08430 [Pseudomonas sp. IB20]|uniref:hypothetical protein n=1 Tax=Pseudomonas TaxID=286 RepID=UPI000BA0411C|nr:MULTISPECIES: hypothetical protein [unclassified Pseudomonas]MCV2228762.1 hypothetical protein [Pseudomonas sp. AU10]OZO04959.1 hypothetical protein B7453_08430 [Pseudomonas sp. IB20]
MVSAQQASASILELFKGSIRDGRPQRFVIQSCELSSDGNFWVIRCNTEDYVVYGKFEYCLVGVNAHLVDVRTGSHETVASCFSVDEYLQDKRDVHAAAGKCYVLVPVFSRESKEAVINLRQKLQCSYPQSFALLSSTGRRWLTGTRRYLEHAQRLLAIEGIATGIELESDPSGAIAIGPETWHINAVLRALEKKRLQDK